MRPLCATIQVALSSTSGIRIQILIDFHRFSSIFHHFSSLSHSLCSVPVLLVSTSVLSVSVLALGGAMGIMLFIIGAKAK